MRSETRSSRFSSSRRRYASGGAPAHLLLLGGVVCLASKVLPCFVGLSHLRAGGSSRYGGARLGRVALQAEAATATAVHDDEAEDVYDAVAPSFTSVESLAIGQKVTGFVMRVSDRAAFVDIGAAEDAYIPAGTLRRGTSISDEFKVGESVTAYVQRRPGQTGRVQLTPQLSGITIFSDRELVSAESFQEKVGQSMTGVVNSVQPFGLLVALPADDEGKHVQGLVPASTIKGYAVGRYSKMLGESVEAEVEEVSPPDASKNQKRWNMRLRLPAIQARAAQAARGSGATRSNNFLSGESFKEKVGQSVTGVVINVARFGLFVALPADEEGKQVQGLVPASMIKEFSEGKYSSMLGDSVEVEVIEVRPPDASKNQKRWNVVLRLPALAREAPPARNQQRRQAPRGPAGPISQSDLLPVETFKDKVGQSMTGVVNGVAKFGLFVALPADEEGKHVQGLVPASMLAAWNQEMYSSMLGDSVEVDVLEVRPPNVEKKQQLWTMVLNLPAYAQQQLSKRTN